MSVCISTTVDFKVGYSPERINPGDKVHRLENIVKIVSGMDEETLVHVYTGILLSHKGNNIGSFVVSQMDLINLFVNGLTCIYYEATRFLLIAYQIIFHSS